MVTWKYIAGAFTEEEPWANAKQKQVLNFISYKCLEIILWSDCGMLGRGNQKFHKHLLLTGQQLGELSRCPDLKKEKYFLKQGHPTASSYKV